MPRGMARIGAKPCKSSSGWTPISTRTMPSSLCRPFGARQLDVREWLSRIGPGKSATDTAMPIRHHLLPRSGLPAQPLRESRSPRNQMIGGRMNDARCVTLAIRGRLRPCREARPRPTSPGNGFAETRPIIRISKHWPRRTRTAPVDGNNPSALEVAISRSIRSSISRRACLLVAARRHQCRCPDGRACPHPGR